MTKHQAISQELRNEIATGVYASGKLPSEAQLVERFGVSRPTVARALRDLQAEGLIERRAGAGSFIRATAPATSPRVLGLLMPERGTTEIFDAICGEIGALSRVHDFGILWGASPVPFVDRDSRPDHAREVCRQFIERGVTGVFFAPFEHADDKTSINLELVQNLHQAGIPVVLLDRDVSDFPKRSGYDLVCLDHFCAGYLLAEHLLRLGCTRLRFFHRPNSAPSVDARISGVREAILQRQRVHASKLSAIDPRDFVVTGDPTDAGFVRSKWAGRLTV